MNFSLNMFSEICFRIIIFSDKGRIIFRPLFMMRFGSRHLVVRSIQADDKLYHVFKIPELYNAK